MSEDKLVAQGAVKRPGCVSVYAVLLWISGGLGVIGGLCTLSGLTGLVEGGVGIAELLLMGISLLFAAIYIVTGYGLWQMKKWAWALVVIYHSLAVIGGLIGLAGGFFLIVDSAAAELSVYLCSALFSLALNGYILYWFIQNRALFNGTQGAKKVIGPDGVEVLEPIKSTGSDAATLLAVGGGLVLVAILVCVVLIAMLAILGPQIGNVFSQITFTLEEPVAGVLLPIR